MKAKDLLPSGRDLLSVAYSMLSGDPLTERFGRYGGGKDSADFTGRTKSELYHQATRNNLEYFNIMAEEIRRWPGFVSPSVRCLRRTEKKTRRIYVPSVDRRLLSVWFRRLLRS